MKIKNKLFVIVLLGAFLSCGQFVASKAVQPEVATSLALEQFANPSIQTDTASRMLDSAYPTVAAGVWLTYFMGSLYWLVPSGATKTTEEEKEVKNEEV